MRNPKWHRDEIILALDLYFSPTRGSLDAKNPNIIELSKILNSLPLFYNKPDEEKFRNPNGVTLKLSNFLPFDPNYTGKGMTSGSKLDKEIFYEFQNKKDELRSIASEIRKVVADEDLKRKIYTIEEDDDKISSALNNLEHHSSIICRCFSTTLDEMFISQQSTTEGLLS